MQPDEPKGLVPQTLGSLISHILLLAILGASVWLSFHPEKVRSIMYGEPCERPIHYTINRFDAEFGISKAAFREKIDKSVAVWEKAVDVNLFEYKETAPNPDKNWWDKIKAKFSNRMVEINLIYDERQEATEIGNELKEDISEKKAASEDVKQQFEALKQRYERERDAYNAAVDAYETRQDAYNDEVQAVNRQGGASAEEYNRLNNEKNALNAEKAELDRARVSVNAMAREINALVAQYNNLARLTNMTIREYNNNTFVGREFEEGTYTTDIDGERIDIYQFSNETKLLRVLTHEFGHALGLDHNDNARSIMYRANQGTSLALTTDDLAALKKVCNVQ